jgi:DNA segregation ATPase FtsK/SpoIIIE, S-DNA-T family
MVAASQTERDRAGRAKKETRQPLLPAGVHAGLRRRAAEIAGAMLIVLAGLIALSLVTYASTDESFNSAGAGSTANLAGLPGAYVSDLILQGMGIAGAVMIIVYLAWGYALLSQRRLSLYLLRFALLPIGVVTMATGFAALPAPAYWPIASGMGGSVGVIVSGALVPFAAGIGIPAWGFAAFSFLLAAVALFAALGLTVAQRRALFGFVWRTLRLAFRLAGRGLVWLFRSRSAAAIAAGADEKSKPRRAASSPRKGLRKRLEPRLFGGKAEPVEEDDAPDPEPPVRLVEKRSKKPKPGKRATKERQGTLDLGPTLEYHLPALDLLAVPAAKNKKGSADDAGLAQNARLLETVLDDFGVQGKIVKVRPGPVVTLYELEAAPGTKSSRVIGLADDIARYMSAISVRVAVVPGRNVIGIEIPNASRETVYLRELFATDSYEATAHRLTLALGKDIGGEPVMADLARMPHLLVAGTTGSGKSVGINSMILSLIYRLSPDECKFIMIDPKMLELSVYDGIPHLLTPVVTEPGKAVVALKWAVREMESRYQAMSKLGVRNIAGYNKRLAEAKVKGENLTRTVQTGFDEHTGAPVFEEQPLDLNPLPFIVVVVDEMADLMLIAGKDVEAAIQRLAQMARAAGIHLIMATQRPSVDVITGTIKANFPTRISFQVISKIDSRTILGDQGAEQLLGQGDMLYMEGGGRITRVHGPFVSDNEVERIVKYVKTQGMPAYLEEVTAEPEASGPSLGDAGANDPLYDQAVALVCRERKASTSFVQRHLQIGYNRAARVIERMEAEGVVSAANHVGKREVLARDIDDIAS